MKKLLWYIIKYFWKEEYILDNYEKLSGSFVFNSLIILRNITDYINRKLKLYDKKLIGYYSYDIRIIYKIEEIIKLIESIGFKRKNGRDEIIYHYNLYIINISSVHKVFNEQYYVYSTHTTPYVNGRFDYENQTINYNMYISYYMEEIHIQGYIYEIKKNFNTELRKHKISNLLK